MTWYIRDIRTGLFWHAGGWAALVGLSEVRCVMLDERRELVRLVGPKEEGVFEVGDRVRIRENQYSGLETKEFNSREGIVVKAEVKNSLYLLVMLDEGGAICPLTPSGQWQDVRDRCWSLQPESLEHI